MGGGTGVGWLWRADRECWEDPRASVCMPDMVISISESATAGREGANTGWACGWCKGDTLVIFKDGSCLICLVLLFDREKEASESGSESFESGVEGGEQRCRF